MSSDEAKIISVINQKGGVGKTTTAVNLSAALGEMGHNVLLVDLDSQANATALFGTPLDKTLRSVFDALVQPEAFPLKKVLWQGEGNVTIAPGALALAGLDAALRDEPGREMLLREILEPVLDEFDFVICDNGPTLGLGPVMSLIAADVALITLQCERLAVDGLGQVIKTIEAVRRRMNPELKRRVLLTMMNKRLKDGQSIATDVRAKLGDEVLQTVVRTNSKLKLAGVVVHHDPSSPGAVDYREVARELTLQPNLPHA